MHRGREQLGTSHLDEDLLLRILRRELPPDLLWSVAHPHLLACCAPCEVEFHAFRGDGDRTAAPIPTPGRHALPDERLHWSLRDYRRRRRVQSRIRALRRRAREDVKALLELSPQQRRRRIENARSRYRTRAVAELLLQESRRRARTEPARATDLAALVSEVLHWTPGAAGTRWAAALALRAAAHQANALRIGGDLPAADRRFAALRRDLVLHPVDDVAALAEATSLEASLRIGQRRAAAADRLLERAALLYRHAGDAGGKARVLIQRANLVLTGGRPGEALEHLDRAERTVDRDDHPYLYLCVVAGRANALCDLDRHRDAAALLTGCADLRRAEDDPHLRATWLLLEGRIAASRDDHRTARETLTASRAAFAEVDRHYDAAIAALYLAEVHLQRGRAGALRELAAELVTEFSARRVERETLAALRLLAAAAAAEAVTRRQLRELRGRLARVAA